MSGFSIHLAPEFKEMVRKSKLGQNDMHQLIKHCHRHWLDGCGFGHKYDPGAPIFPALRQYVTCEESPTARHLYDEHSIRVGWGEWGPEHITVPGDACGLDIDTRPLGGFKGGAALYPHNVDSTSQAMLLLVVFTQIEHTVSLEANIGQ